MDGGWFYARAGSRAGPVPEADLVQWLREGRLDHDTLVWQTGMANWVPAHQVDRLAPPMPPAPPFPASATGAEATYAGFWKRFAAALVDGLVIGGVGFAVGMAIGLGFAFTGGSEAGLEIASNLIGVILGWLYAAWFESSPSMGTLGKQAMGIQVTDLDGNRISFARATGRHFGKILSALPLFIGYLMVAFTERKQGLHDILAGCLVVNRVQ